MRQLWRKFQSLSSNAKIAISIGLIASFIILLSTVIEPSGSQKTAVAPSTVTVFVTPTMTTTTTTSRSLSSSATTEIGSSTTSVSVEPEVKDLKFFDKVSNDSCTRFVEWQEQAPQIAGTAYGYGFGCPIMDKVATGSIDFLVPAGLNRLIGAVGQDDRSSNTTGTVEFSVASVTGKELFKAILGYGQKQEINVPLEGVSRVQLKMRLLSYKVEPWARKTITISWAGMQFKR